MDQNQDYLLDSNACSFVCLVLEEDVEASRPQNVLSFCSVPVEALSPVPEISHGDCRGRVCDLTALESQVKLDFQCCSFLGSSAAALVQVHVR